MKTLKIYGGSDDLIECSGIDGCDEFNYYGGDHNPYMGKLVVKSKEISFDVHVIYDGNWLFSVSCRDWEEGTVLSSDPAVLRTFGDDSPYSETLLIECADDATLIFVKPGE